MDVTYPPQPWQLTGRNAVGVWLVPAAQAPLPHAPSTRQLRLFGRVIVAAAFFRYDEPSPLTYGEIMATQIVLDGWRPRISITHIWVDSPASMAGGREMWAIPKDLAIFDIDPERAWAAQDIGTLEVERTRTLPGLWPLVFRLAQGREGAVVTTPVSGRIKLARIRGRWHFDPAGPLGFLTGRRPLCTFGAAPFYLKFGR